MVTVCARQYTRCSGDAGGLGMPSILVTSLMGGEASDFNKLSYTKGSQTLLNAERGWCSLGACIPFPTVSNPFPNLVGCSLSPVLTVRLAGLLSSLSSDSPSSFSLAWVLRWPPAVLPASVLDFCSFFWHFRQKDSLGMLSDHAVLCLKPSNGYLRKGPHPYGGLQDHPPSLGLSFPVSHCPLVSETPLQHPSHAACSLSPKHPWHGASSGPFAC